MWDWLSQNQGALAGIVYGLAVLGTHLPDHTIVGKFCRWIVQGKKPTADEGSK